MTTWCCSDPKEKAIRKLYRAILSDWFFRPPVESPRGHAALHFSALTLNARTAPETSNPTFQLSHQSQTNSLRYVAQRSCTPLRLTEACAILRRGDEALHHLGVFVVAVEVQDKKRRDPAPLRKPDPLLYARPLPRERGECPRPVGWD